MSERLGIKLRQLPDGPILDAFEMGLNGRFLELDVTGLDLPVGSLLEIERGPMLCLGELQRKSGQIATVLVEHALDRDRLKPIRDIWG